ncbi:ATP-binding cassette domain-containing protein [Bradyrhizobium sp. AS23.2]|uniref:ABC transporter ATP-binding protein n=1 Tax=Bradyrhizobium sp. AS23.2 TaxID=1680155 RepID=UPI00093A302C|nr:ATP-binding cassette domain-containing protein [Bradyrhizobium sp. AS23.2]OKO74262.1 ABC transporter ATP-binding protein [Bradyrhizobium sp. AS23.2]
MTHSILEAKNLHVAFNGVKAADGVSIAIHQGEFLAIIGPNGSGKTTLLNICTGYIRPRSGSVLLDGHDITRLSPRAIARRGVARAFQIPQLFSAQRVIDNMMLALAATDGLWTAIRPLDTGARREEAEALLDLVGLADDADRICSTLPEGHRKLLDIAVALALKPRLLLLDEPTSGVSALERFPLMEALMSALRQRHITALFVEHDMDVVARYASRVLVWNAGNIMAEGRPDEVFGDAQVRERVVGVA